MSEKTTVTVVVKGILVEVDKRTFDICNNIPTYKFKNTGAPLHYMCK